MTVAISVIMEFHKKLRLHMKDLRLSQEDIAEDLNVSQGLVSRWVRGVNKPDVFQALDLANALGVSLDYLADERRPVMTKVQMERDTQFRRVLEMIGPDEAWRRLLGAPVSGPTQFSASGLVLDESRMDQGRKGRPE